MDLTTDTVVYQGIQRHYRNAVVAFMRSRLNAAFGDTWESAINQTFKAEEWTQIEANARSARTSGVIGTPINDVADMLSVNHFFNLFERYYKEFWPDAAQPREQRTNILAWARTIKQFRDPISHPSEAPLSFNDAHHVLDTARRVLKFIDEDAASAVGELEDFLQFAPRREVGSLVSVLPARETIVVDFVGRIPILNALHRWFDDPHSRLRVLSGDGGKGKSSIAYTFATQICARAPDQFYLVAWISAKRRAFVDGAFIQLEPQFVDRVSCVDRLLEAYGAAEEGDAQHREARLIELLTEVPALIVADDVDTLEGAGEEAAIEFLLFDVQKTHSKVLFTSRRELFGLRNVTTVVGGMLPDDANEFVRKRIGLYGFEPSRFSPNAIQRIIDITDASPLYMEDLLRLCGAMGPSEAIHGWEQNRGSRVREFALSRELELLSSGGRQIVLACALAEGPVSSSELRVIAGVSDDDVVEALSELRLRYLVPEPSLVGDEPRYTLNRNTKALAASLFQNTPTGRQVTAALRNLGDVGGAAIPEPEITSICRRVALLVRQGDTLAAQDVLTRALDGSFPEHPRLLAQMGWVHARSKPPGIAEARKFFNRAFEMGNRITQTYLDWIEMEASTGDVESPIQTAERGLERCGRSDPRLLLAYGQALFRRTASGSALLDDSRRREIAVGVLRVLQEARLASGRVPLNEYELRRLYHQTARAARVARDQPAWNDVMSVWAQLAPDDSYYISENAEGMRTTWREVVPRSD